MQIDPIVFVNEVCSCKNLYCIAWDLLLGLHGKKNSIPFSIMLYSFHRISKSSFL